LTNLLCECFYNYGNSVRWARKAPRDIFRSQTSGRFASFQVGYRNPLVRIFERDHVTKGHPSLFTFSCLHCFLICLSSFSYKKPPNQLSRVFFRVKTGLTEKYFGRKNFGCVLSKNKTLVLGNAIPVLGMKPKRV